MKRVIVACSCEYPSVSTVLCSYGENARTHLLAEMSTTINQQFVLGELISQRTQREHISKIASNPKRLGERLGCK